MKVEDIKFENDILAIMPEKLGEVITVRQEAIVSDDAFMHIEDAVNRRATQFKNVKGKVVIVPLAGFISHKSTIWSAIGLETSSEMFGQWIESLVGNNDVGAVVIDVDSPGGTCAGLSAITDKIYSLRGKKPIIAVVNDLMGSAAYFIGSAADEIVADPDSLIGSIGTIGLHIDWSGALKEAGIKPTFIYAGEHKTEGNPLEPLSDEAKRDWQNMVNEYYDTFIGAVARNRNTTKSKVESDFGQGRVFKASKARSVGMIDRIATMEQVIKDLQPKGKSKSLARAKLDVLLRK